MIEVIKNGEYHILSGNLEDGDFLRESLQISGGIVVIEYPHKTEDVTVIRAEKILKIKAEAERRIRLLDWRLERAKERKALGIVGYETVNDIYQLKEDIRQWSNELEVVLMQLDSIEEVNAFSLHS